MMIPKHNFFQINKYDPLTTMMTRSKSKLPPKTKNLTNIPLLSLLAATLLLLLIRATQLQFLLVSNAKSISDTQLALSLQISNLLRSSLISDDPNPAMNFTNQSLFTIKFLQCRTLHSLRHFRFPPSDYTTYLTRWTSLSCSSVLEFDHLANGTQSLCQSPMSHSPRSLSKMPNTEPTSHTTYLTAFICTLLILLLRNYRYLSLLFSTKLPTHSNSKMIRSEFKQKSLPLTHSSGTLMINLTLIRMTNLSHQLKDNEAQLEPLHPIDSMMTPDPDRSTSSDVSDTKAYHLLSVSKMDLSQAKLIGENFLPPARGRYNQYRVEVNQWFTIQTHPEPVTDTLKISLIRPHLPLSEVNIIYGTLQADESDGKLASFPLRCHTRTGIEAAYITPAACPSFEIFVPAFVAKLSLQQDNIIRCKITSYTGIGNAALRIEGSSTFVHIPIRSVHQLVCYNKRPTRSCRIHPARSRPPSPHHTAIPRFTAASKFDPRPLFEPDPETEVMDATAKQATELAYKILDDTAANAKPHRKAVTDTVSEPPRSPGPPRQNSPSSPNENDENNEDNLFLPPAAVMLRDPVFQRAYVTIQLASIDTDFLQVIFNLMRAHKMQ